MFDQVFPMLASEAIRGEVTYPKFSSPKLNGVRGMRIDATHTYARSKKLIPNAFTQRRFSNPKLQSMDGELIVGDEFSPNVFVNSQGGVMSRTGEPDVRLFVFDLFDIHTLDFATRQERLAERVAEIDSPWVVPVLQKMVFSDDEAWAHMKTCCDLGYEGVVLRDPDRPYEFGRSTGFLRLTPWLTSEARVLTVFEGKLATGPSGRCGSVLIEDIHNGQVFNMTIGKRTDQTWFWKNQEAVKGLILKYHFKQTVMVGGLPRFPQFLGFRDPIDMS